MTTKGKDNDEQPQVRFPEKLWCLVENDETGAIQWNSAGDGVIINMQRFRDAYLLATDHFKTRRIASFVRQLNLYGFYKTGESVPRGTPDEEIFREYKHPLFVRNMPTNVEKIQRQDLIKRRLRTGMNLNTPVVRRRRSAITMKLANGEPAPPLNAMGSPARARPYIRRNVHVLPPPVPYGGGNEVYYPPTWGYDQNGLYGYAFPPPPPWFFAPGYLCPPPMGGPFGYEQEERGTTSGLAYGDGAASYSAMQNESGDVAQASQLTPSYLGIDQHCGVPPAPMGSAVVKHEEWLPAPSTTGEAAAFVDGGKSETSVDIVNEFLTFGASGRADGNEQTYTTLVEMKAL